MNHHLSLFKEVPDTLITNIGKRRYVSTTCGSMCITCGIGTRCHFCTWCVGNSYNQSSRSILDTSLVATPYRKAYIDMFEDLSSKIQNDYFKKPEIVEIMKQTAAALKVDTEAYNHNIDLISVTVFIESFYRKLQIYKETDDANTKKFIYKYIQKITNLWYKVSEVVVSYVESTCDILK